MVAHAISTYYRNPDVRALPEQYPYDEEDENADFAEEFFGEHKNYLDAFRNASIVAWETNGETRSTPVSWFVPVISI